MLTIAPTYLNKHALTWAAQPAVRCSSTDTALRLLNNAEAAYSLAAGLTSENQNNAGFIRLKFIP